MRKILLVIAAAFATAVTVSAQDMAQATETYNNGAMALQAGNYSEALEGFKSALTMAEACGEEGADIVENCRQYIPKIMLYIAKDSIKAEKYDEGLAELDGAIAQAKEYEVEEVVTEAEGLVPQVYMSKAGDLMKAQDYAGAAASYKKAAELDPTNGMAYLYLGQAYAKAGDSANAEAAYIAAAANGQEKSANKQLSNIYLKKAQTAYKSKKYADAYDAAMKSNGYVENGNALYFAGLSAQNLGQNAKAQEAFEQFLATAPNDKKAPDVKYTLAVMHQNAGDKAKAIEYYKQVLTSPKYGEYAKAQISALQK